MGKEPIKKVLKSFGLTEKETEVYIFLAKQGVLRGRKIAKQMKKDKGQVYRILKSLQKKGLVESTLEFPTRFTAVPFEKVLDLFIKSKQEEVTFIEKAKKDLLDDWKNISGARLKPPLEKFVVIEGSKKIYLKILQMIEETKKQLSAISTVPGLFRAEQFGVFDAAYNHPLKSKIKFRFLTELSRQNFKAMKLLKTKLKPELVLKGMNPDPSLALFPRMVIRDEEEIMFFISPKTDMFRTKRGQACLCTNCKSLVQTLTVIFEDLWRNSIDIEERIFEVETGKLLPKPLLDKGAETAKNYDAAFSKVKEHARSLPLLAAQLARIEHFIPEMVGRDKELWQLEEYLQEASKGRGKTILISGEAGIGKTRLVSELIIYAKSHNFRVLECRCLHESATPFWPFRKILRDFFKISKDDTTEERRKKIKNVIKEIVPQLTQAIPIVDNIIAGLSIDISTFEEDKRRIDAGDLKSLFKSEEALVIVSQLLTALSEKQPIMLFVDDLHFADTSSLKLFQNVARTIQESNLFLVGAYRQEAVTTTVDGTVHPLLDTLQRMNRDNLYQKIELKRLSKTDCSVLINSILGVDEDELVKRIYEETEGNPFFILETLRLLINQKLLIKKDDKWKFAKNIKDIEIPPRIHDVLAHRIHILKEEERDILDCASVVGEEFSSDVIEVITGLNRLRVLKKLNNIERKYQLIHSFDGKFRFDHSKIREFLYQEIALELRKEYHSLIGEHLEETFREHFGEAVNELAYHYYRSGNAQKGVPYLLKAGEDARQKWVIFETIGYFSQALEMMGDDERWSNERAETLEALGGLYGLAAQHERANECYKKGIASTEDDVAKDRMRRKIRRKKIIEKDGVKLAYFVYGEGEPTLFLLAWASTAELWIPQVTYFSQKYKVVTVDLRGTGESDKPPGEYTIDLYMDDIQSIIEDLKCENIVFVGLSLGGMIATKYIVKYPGKVAKLVLYGMAPKPLATDDFPFGFFKPNEVKEFSAFAEKSPSKAVKLFWNLMFSGRVRVNYPKELMLSGKQKTPPEIFLEGLRS